MKELLSCEGCVLGFDLNKNLQNNGFALGICTNKPQKITERLLEKFSIRHFFGDAILGGDTLTVRKPDPRHLLAVTKNPIYPKKYHYGRR